MSESIKKRAVVVGVFIVVGLIFLVGGILAIGNLHSTFSQKMNISTVVNDVNGLQAGNNIWFSGVKVGTVKKVEFFGNSQVKITMNINEESQQYIRKNAKVKISSDGFIGNKILVIYGGTADAPAIQEGDILVNEATLSTDDIMKTLQENNKNILVITSALAAGQGSLGKMIKDDSLYNSFNNILATLQRTSNKAQSFMTYLADYSAQLRKEGSLSNDLITDTTIFNSLQTTMYELNKIADTTAAMMNSLNVAMNNTKTPLGVMTRDEQTGAALKETIIRLDSSSVKLDEDLEAMQHNFLLKGYFKDKDKAARKAEKEKAKAK
jgi:phospholipid/cholesterol/gamma-HCH transport system substrate-binding protein